MIASAISFLLRRSKSISDGFSIRGPFQIASFRLSKAVEGVTKLVAPPVLEFHAVSLSKGIQLLLRRTESTEYSLPVSTIAPAAFPPTSWSQPRRLARVPP